MPQELFKLYIFERFHSQICSWIIILSFTYCTLTAAILIAELEVIMVRILSQAFEDLFVTIIYKRSAVFKLFSSQL